MSELTITFRAPPDSVDVVHAGLDALWRNEPTVAGPDRWAFETAVIELASNVLQHASSHAAILCSLHVVADADALRAVLTDSADEPDIDMRPREMPDPLAESGRGIALINALVDDFDYRRSDLQNIWTLTLSRAAPAASP
ncbi:ATP-binding protein [Microbacterium sp. LWH3-1.2]|uniref:ATP-binding protein n=1 Tax=Microbacterium sp. LWH3-1.2 TaxID=3135256 RepID=UPI00343A63E3